MSKNKFFEVRIFSLQGDRANEVGFYVVEAPTADLKRKLERIWGAPLEGSGGIYKGAGVFITVAEITEDKYVQQIEEKVKVLV